MSKPIAINHSNIGWNFENSYTRLPDYFYTRICPEAVHQPHVVILNQVLAQSLGLELDRYSSAALAQVFSGNELPAGTEPIAQAYAGHQFGYFTPLGDGRAHLLGEHITPAGNRVDIQFKGSGKTPYSRSGDGRAALGPMLREYVISEAMHALGVPTTRGLVVVTTGEPVYRDTVLQGAILTRVAASHLRIGTFEYLASQKDIQGLRQLADYAIDRHYPALAGSGQPYVDFLNAVMERQIILVAEWLRVGFIHGVMNTDNTTISGETIDYGPCAFMDQYAPDTVFSSIDHAGRYAYANQAHIIQWNLARLAESLLPLLHEDLDEALALAEAVIHSYPDRLQSAWLAMMRRKLGLAGDDKDDVDLIDELLKWMQQQQADYTNTFRALSSEDVLGAGLFAGDQAFKTWYDKWQARLRRNGGTVASAMEMMRGNNPARIPRNHLVEEALDAAELQSDISKVHELLKAVSAPYQDDPQYARFTEMPVAGERVYQTFCGT